MIPQAVIDEILRRTNIEHLIGGYVTLKRAGSNMNGLCPFHSEKTPSFTVFTGANNFYCFGCGVGGDAITFVRKIENLDYPDAVAFLAKRAGITIPEDDGTRRTQKPKVDRKRLLALHREAALFFHRNLYDKEGEPALHYLTEKRGFSHATIKHFGLGFARNSYESLTRHCLSLGYTEVELVESYLSFRNNRGTLSDSFRNRVMFPIIDVTGNVIAFGGRVMDDSLPKYKNSSDTPIFKKSRQLYALNFARTSCAESLLLCEGYMDVIAMHAAGFENAVATLGTAITSEQARLISRYTKQVIISYDMDDAGRRAADKAMKLLEEVGLNIRLLTLTEAKDPDEYIRRFGADKFRSLLLGSASRFEYNTGRILSKYDLSVPQQKIDATVEICQMIANISASVERSIYIQEVAHKLNVDAKSIEEYVSRILSKKAAEYKQKKKQALYQQTMGYRDPVNPDFAKDPALARYEETVLGLLLLYPEHRHRNLVSESDFFTDFGKRVFTYIFEHLMDENEENVNFNAYFTPEEVSRITKMKISRMRLTENGNDVFVESVDALKNAVSLRRNKDEGNQLELISQIITRKRNTDDYT
ncbi:MAG: DNA primase [Eubacteriales bacterium]